MKAMQPYNICSHCWNEARDEHCTIVEDAVDPAGERKIFSTLTTATLL